MAFPEPRAPLAQKVNEENVDLSERRDPRGYRVLLESREVQVIQENRERLVQLARWGRLVLLAPRVKEGPQVNVEPLVLGDLRVRKDQPVLPELLGLRVNRVRKEK